MSHGVIQAEINCLECHETSACLTPTKPQGTCSSCHLGAGDINDYQSNFIPAMIDDAQWQTQGHGQPGIALACEYCHNYDVHHGDAANPFRLVNVTTPDADGQNTNCLACHGTDSVGVDPDGPASAFALVNSFIKIDSNHAGHKHNDLTDGGRFCWDCHDPHGDTNIVMIHDAVSMQSDGQFGIPATSVPVSFSQNSTGSDYVNPLAPYDGICQACHTQTNHWRNDGSLADHNIDLRCLTCHEHNEGFQPNCNSCHGYPPVVDIPRGVDGLVVTPEPTGSTSAGAHALHATGSGYGYSCSICHYGGMPDTPIFDNYRIQMGFDLFGFAGAGSIYNGQTLTGSYGYEGTNGTAISFTGVPTTCENLYCHSDGTAVSTSFLDPATYPGPHQSSPPWIGGTTSCTSCHGYPPNYPFDQPKANVHERHVNLFNVSLNYDPNPCHFCHYNTTTDGVTITNKANHVNRRYDVAPDPSGVFRINSLTSTNVDFTYTYDPGGGTCSNITCHQIAGFSETLPWGFDATITAGYSATAGSACGEISFAIIVTADNAVPPYTYYIDWESDGVWDYEGPDNNHTHAYADITPKVITYSVRDAKGHTLPGDGTKETSPVYPSSVNAPPVVSVTPSVNGYTVTLTDQSTDPDYNACGHSGTGRAMIDWGPGGYVYYDLNLTDTPSGQQFSYTYSSPGNYTIRYGVYDNVITYPVFHPNIAVTVPQN